MFFQVVEVDFWKEFVMKGKIPDDDDSDRSELPLADPESNIYNFGVLMLEIISGKLPHCEEGSIVNWVKHQNLLSFRLQKIIFWS